MRLYMKEQAFSMTTRFSIKDEQENDRYFVEGEFLTLGRKLHLLDMSNNEVAFIAEKLFTLLPKFEIFIGGNLVSEVIKEFTFFMPKYVISGTSWEIQGDIFEHNYSIIDKGNLIATISKAYFSWGDSFVIDVFNPKHEVLAIASVLAIDCVMDYNNN